MKWRASRCAEGLAAGAALSLVPAAVWASAAEPRGGLLALAGWLVALLAILVGALRLQAVRERLAAAHRDGQARGETLARARAALPQVQERARVLSQALTALQGHADIHRTALTELDQTVAGAAARAGELAELACAAAGQPPAPAPAPMLEELEPALLSLEAAASGIGEKFARLQERTEEIARAVATLEKVSERINLLSLNAAIESEKAGERGHGFVAIAQEIRRLADHTAATSLGVGRELSRAREVVGEGVMSVDRFLAQVRAGLASARRAAGPWQAGAAGAPVAPAAEAVTAAARLSQAANERLRTATRGLSEGDEKLQERLREVVRLAAQLASAVEALEAADADAGALP